jgi:hypothetical protein
MLWALLLIAACVLVFVANAGGETRVYLIPGLRDLALVGMSAIVYLCFVIVGVVIGFLLK